jgi:hypothetical protein
MLDIAVGAPQAHRNLTIFPLLAERAPELPYALLADALAAGTVHVGEVGQGTVPALMARNDGDLDVLVLDGEQLIGSKQNRMTNRSLLLPAGSTIELPVSCMEHGRWRFDSQEMWAAPQHSPAKVRRSAREVEARRARVGQAAAQDVLREAQAEVWDAIADTASKLGVHSATGAMDALYVERAPDLEEMLHAFPPVEGQVGLLAFAGEAPIGLDVVGGCALYVRLHGRLLRGYVMDALDRASGHSCATAGAPDCALAPTAPAARAYLDAVRVARRVPSPTVGKGTYAVLAGTVIGGELLDEDRVAHLSAFPEDPGPGPRSDGGCVIEERPLPPPSERRRHGRRFD